MREFRAEHERKSCILKAVFEERGYYIVNIKDCGVFVNHSRNSIYNSLLIHKCPSTMGVYNHTTHLHPYISRGFEDPIKCSLCNIWVPESIQTLWTLQNADAIGRES